MVTVKVCYCGRRMWLFWSNSGSPYPPLAPEEFDHSQRRAKGPLVGLTIKSIRQRRRVSISRHFAGAPAYTLRGPTMLYCPERRPFNFPGSLDAEGLHCPLLPWLLDEEMSVKDDSWKIGARRRWPTSPAYKPRLPNQTTSNRHQGAAQCSRTM